MSNDVRDPDDLIHAYLRGRLPEADAAALEQRLESDPGQWREFERVLRTHAGLAYLDERGDLTRLPPAAPWYRRASTLAAAATLASVAVGARWLLELTTGGREPGLSTTRAPDQSLAARILLVRTRGEIPTLPRPGAGMLDIRVRPEFPAHSRFDFELTLPANGDAAPRPLTVSNVQLDTDGHVRVFLTAAEFPLGEYRVRITPVGGAADEVSDFEFVITRESSVPEPTVH